jgi:ribosomal protein S18 acetylase RimI-like enzyme
MSATPTNPAPRIFVERLQTLSSTDLEALCSATEDTISDNNLSFSVGLNRTDSPSRERLENYWRGVVLVPERVLIVGRIDNNIASAIQLVKPSPSNQTSAFAGSLDHHFVAPWARGHGLAKLLVAKAEAEAKTAGISVLRLSVRAELESAIKCYESLGYVFWGNLPLYEMVDGIFLAGHFYYKKLEQNNA